MKLIILSLLWTGSLLAQNSPPVTSATLNESEVRITYGELRRLVEAARPQEASASPKAAPPVSAALLSCAYHVDVKAGRITAEMQVENFDGTWQAIPLAGATSGAMSVQPKDARLIIKDEHLCLATDKAGAQGLQLVFALGKAGQGSTLHCAPSPVAWLDVTGLPEGKVLNVQHERGVQTLVGSAAMALPAVGGEIILMIEDAHQASQRADTGSVEDAILTTAIYSTQVVRDGSLLTEGTLSVHHDHPAKLLLQLPANCKLLQCHVNGNVTRAVLGAEGQLEISLDDPATDGGESEVKLSFTGTLAPLLAAEGELDLTLPKTPLFARQIDWNVQLPEGYDLSFSGNVDAVTDKTTTPGLHLRKSLCRDQKPEARLTYRKRTSN